MIAAIAATIAARRRRVRRLEGTPYELGGLSRGVPSISGGGSRGLASPAGNRWGSTLFSIGSGIVGIGFRVIVFGVAVWAGLGAVRWTFSLAAKEANAIKAGASKTREDATALTA